MPELYNRILCGFCPVKDRCDEIRWHKRCGTCQYSLKCAAGPGLGHVDCKLITGDWLSLPSKCLIAANRLKKFAETGEEKGFRRTQDKDDVEQIVCPRCGEATMQRQINHTMNHVFKRKSEYILTCSRCGIDESVET
jgi:transcription elongation factor Elf1